MTNETTQKFYYPSEEVVKNAAVSGMEAYKALCAEADQDYEGFWGKRAKELIDWQTPFTQVLDESNAPFFKWFADGKLNVSYNCLDRNVEAGLGDKVAILSETDDGAVRKVTYRELLAMVCRLANGLRAWVQARLHAPDGLGPRSAASHSPLSPAEMTAFQPAMEMPNRLQAISSQRTTGAASSAVIRSCVDMPASPETPPEQCCGPSHSFISTPA